LFLRDRTFHDNPRLYFPCGAILPYSLFPTRHLPITSICTQNTLKATDRITPET